MDYEGTRDTASDVPMGEVALNRPASDLTAAAAASAGTGGIALVPDVNNTVVLPEGATLDDIAVRGRDLVITLDDGRIYIIADGAVFVPQIVAQGVTVPPLNLAALLIGQEPEPAAGPVRSSGGNFEVPVDPLQDAYDLGNLLPYTELAFPEPRQREIFPIADREPETTPNAVVQLDDDALSGGNPGGTGDDPDAANTTGTLSGSGGDGALTWALSPDGAPAGFSYTANGTGIDVRQGTTLVLRVTLDPATGAYAVTQVAAIVHPNGDNENNVTFTFGYTVTDSDGDSATGALTVNVDDDSPTVTGNTTGGTVDEDGLAGGIAGGDGDVAGTATTASGSVAGLFSAGADGGLVYSMTANTSGLPALTSGGVAVTYAVSGNVLTASAGTGNTVFTLTLDPATAQWSFVLVKPLDHPAGNAENDLVLQLGSLIAATDRDGDSVTANPASLTVTVDDDTPMVNLSETEVSFLTVDETDLGTNASADYSGFFTALYGADGPAATNSLTYALGINSVPVGLIDTATGLAVVLTLESGQVIGRAGADGPIVFAVSVDATGTVTLDQRRAVVHDDTNDPNDSEGFDGSDAITLIATATDRDGDTASQPVSIAGLMRILDDGPDAKDDTDSVKEDGPSVADGNVFSGSGGSDANDTDGTADAPGADGANSASVVVAIAGGTVGTRLDGTYGSVTIDANGAYEYVLDNTNPAVQALDDGESLSEEFTYTITDRDGDTSFATLRITIEGTNDRPEISPATAAVSEEGLAGGRADTAGTPDTTDSATASGTIAASDVDGDTLSFTLATPTPALTSSGTAITWTGAGTGTLVGSAGGTEVIRITIDSTGAYTVTLSDQIDHPTANVEDSLNLVVPVIVSDGTTTNSTTLTIGIQDDSPVALEGTTSGTVDEDGLPGGIAGGDGDVAGAPTSATGSVTGLFASGADSPLTYGLSSDTSGLPALTSGGVALSYAVAGNTITAAAGSTTVFTLTLNAATGGWTFALSAPLDHAAADTEDDIQINFGSMITATDRDGDKATAVGDLVVMIDDDSPVAQDDTDEILSGSSAPATGNVLTDNAPGDAGDTDDGADSLGADGGASDGTVIKVVSVNVPANSDDTPAANGDLVVQGEYGTLTLNQDGSYSYTRNAGTPGNVEDRFTYTVTDADGDTDTATLTIVIEDARPITTANAPALLDDDAQPGGNPDGTGDDPGGFSAGGTLTGSGGDGALTWAFQLPAASGGFTYEFGLGGSVLVKQGGTTVLTVTLNSATGAYTVTQNAPIVHTDGGDENNQLFTLGYRVTDSDGDFADGSLTINVDDDSPAVTGAITAASVMVDETNASGLAAGVFTSPVTATSAAAIITATSAFGADGAALSGATSYGLTLTGDVLSLASGLATAVGDQPITLNQTNATTITGTYGAGLTAFTIAIDPTSGVLTVSLNVPLEHLVDGLPGPAHDDALNLAGLVNATITIEDRDGDTASTTAGIGDAITFKDDGPTASVSITSAPEPVLTTQDAETDGTPTASDSASSSTLFGGVFTFSGGSGMDGLASSGQSYTLAVTNAASGLTSNGTAISLYLIAGKVVGSTAASVGAVTTGNTVFDIAVSGTGEVTLTQYQQVDHPLEATTTAPFDDQFATLADGKVTLTLTHTVIDNDGDSASDSETVDLGGNIRFADDGPDISATLTGTQIRIDETDGVVAAGGEVDPLGGGNLGTVTLTAASLFTLANANVSADAPTTLTYALKIAEGAASGLLLSSTNQPIVLHDAGGGLIEGRVGTTSGAIAFTVSINPATGAVTLTQFLAVEHPTPGASHDEDSSGLTAGALLIEVKATDFDGDTDTATVDLGSVIRFEDDGPSVTNAAAAGSVTVDESNATSTVGDVFVPPVVSTSGTAIITATSAFGADGAALSGATSYGLTLTGDVLSLASGLATAVGDQPITLNQTNATTITGTYGAGLTAFTIAIDPTSGVLTVSLNVPLEHLVDGLPGPAHDDALNLAGLVNATITVTDSDGDTASATAGIGSAITFKDDGPTLDVFRTEVAEPVLTTQDAETDGTPTASDSASTTSAFGGVFGSGSSNGYDGFASATTSYTLAVTNAASGLTSNGTAISLYLIAGKVVGSTAASVGAVTTGNTVFDIAVSGTGEVTLTQYQQVDHPLEATTDAPFDDQFATLAGGKVTLTFAITTFDRDGDSATDSETVDLGGNIRFADDGPDIGATLTGTQIRIDETDGVVAAGGEVDPLGGGNLGTVTLTAASLFTLANANVSADAPTTLTYALKITEGAASGLLLSSTNQPIVLHDAGGGLIEGRVGTTSGAIAFTVSINPATGAVTLTQFLAVEHPTPGASHDEDSSGLTAGALLIEVKATDFDGDTDTATVDLGSVIRFEDDGPGVTASTSQPMLIVDETLLGTDASASFAGVFATAFGADGPAASGSVTYALGINAGATGLVDVATGEAVTLVLNAGVVEGRSATTNQLVFTLSVAADGTVTLDQRRAVQHNDPLDHDEPGLSAATLAADNLITLTATATDSDGDIATAIANIGQNLQFEDDGPTITSVTTPLNIVNSGTVSNTGNFVFSTGNDGAAGVNDAIKSVTFNGTVNGVAVGSPTIVAGTEDATTATYTISFTYATGATTTATATGTLVFNKAAGTYTVDLDGPIQGFTINSTAAGQAFIGYELNSAATDGSQPAVAVTQISNTLFLQFTSIAEQSSGTGANNLFTVNYGLDPTPPNDGAGASFSNGELFSQTASWVSISNTANGVAGDTISQGEVLDFNLYSSNPQGFIGTAPSASTSTMYLKFDGIGTAEDFIMILKLWNPSTMEYTTRALMVQNSDIQKGPGTGPGVFSGITLDNNDGLIVIESNDYNFGSENFVIVGAQIAGSDEGITGTAINFNNATGAGGASTGTQAFSTDIGDGPMKISDIGFITTSTTEQNAQLVFDVTVQDRDGDTASQTLTVNVGAAPIPAEPLSAKTTATTSFAEAAPTASKKLAATSSELIAASSAAASGLLAAMAIEHASPAADAGLAKAALAVGKGLGHGSADVLPDFAATRGLEMADLGRSHATSADAMSTRAHSTADTAELRAGLSEVSDLAAANQAQAGNDASKSGLFDVMDALLAQGTASAKVPAGSGHAALVAALEDGAGAQAVDAIVDHFAGANAGMPEQLGQGDSKGFETLLERGVNGGGADFAASTFTMMPAIDHDEANAMA